MLASLRLCSILLVTVFVAYPTGARAAKPDFSTLSKDILKSDTVADLKDKLSLADIVLSGRVKNIEVKETTNEENIQDTRTYIFVTYEVDEVIKGLWDEKTYTIQCHPICSDCPIFKEGDHDVIFAVDAFLSGCDVIKRFRILNNDIYSDDAGPVLLGQDNSIQYSNRHNPELRRRMGYLVHAHKDIEKFDFSSGEQFDKQTFFEYLRALLYIAHEESKSTELEERKPKQAKKSDLKPTFKQRLPILTEMIQEENPYDIDALPPPRNESEAKEQEQIKEFIKNRLRIRDRSEANINKNLNGQADSKTKSISE